jgi:hypothetical protein
MIHAILAVPPVFWLLLILGQAYHYLNKVVNDPAANAVAAEALLKSKRRWAGLALNFFASSMLILALWPPYQMYLAKNPDSPYQYASYIVVIFISVGGSSVFNSLMDIINKKFNKIKDQQE